MTDISRTPDDPDGPDDPTGAHDPAAAGSDPVPGGAGAMPDLAAMMQSLLGDTSDPMVANALAQMGIDKLDPATLGMLSAQIQSFFAAAPSDGLNLEMATDLARKTSSGVGDPSVTGAQSRSVAEAVHLADLWLSDATAFERPGLSAHAWSRAEWVAATMPTWGSLVAPVASGVQSAMVAAMRKQVEDLGEGELPPELAAMAPAGMDMRAMFDQMTPFMGQMSSTMFSAQTGQAVGTLAADVLTGCEPGIPLVPDNAVALLPANITAFAEGLELDPALVQVYLAVRESARARLFHAVPWLGPQLLAAVQAYASDISIDTEGIETKLTGIDIADPDAVREALTDGLFTPTPSPAQKSALARLETLLALVEGWVDVVSAGVARAHLPSSETLAEVIRRRRATGGPAEHVFAQLVGLQLRPRRLKDAANLFAALESAGGGAARDGAWAHPDMAPNSADLDDPLGYVDRLVGSSASGPGDDMDAELAKLIGDEQRATERRRQVEIDMETGPTDAGPWPNWPDPPIKGRRPPATPPSAGQEPGGDQQAPDQA